MAPGRGCEKGKVNGNTDSSILPVPQGRHLSRPWLISQTPHLPLQLAHCSAFKPYPDSDHLYPRLPTLYLPAATEEHVIPLLRTLPWLLTAGSEEPVCPEAVFSSSMNCGLYSHHTPCSLPAQHPSLLAVPQALQAHSHLGAFALAVPSASRLFPEISACCPPHH